MSFEAATPRDFARSFERAAEAYEQGRPGYADAALDAVGLPPESVVLDLAAGTGKLTRQLAPRFARVVAVETVKTGLWRAPSPGPFEPFAESHFPNPVELDREGVLARMGSHSAIAALPDPDRARVLAELAALIPEGRYLHPLRTELHLTRLA